jgi:hypothetical protein
MATKLLFPLSFGRGRSFRDARRALDDKDVAESIRSVGLIAHNGWHQEWNQALLAWRLEMPGGSYSLHVLPDCVAISATDRIAGIKVAVLLKVLPFRTTSRVNGRRVAARLVRFHRTPFVVYWGRHSRLRTLGVILPKRLQPSPLEVVLHLFDADKAHLDLVLDDFELLDLDAY